MKLHEEYLNPAAAAAPEMRVIPTLNPCEFNDHMDQDREIWPLDRDQQEDLLNNDSIFSDDFPALLDFPCMSSSSSSSSIPAPVKPITCSSSSSSASSDQNPQPYSVDQNTNDCTMDFGCMDLLEEPNDFFDPSSVFTRENPVLIEGNPAQASSEDLAHVFLEWLKNNKESISAEDLRSVKIKKSTIECAAKRLGGGKEAMKQLLKLILEWVQTNHLQKRRCHQPPPPPPSQWQQPSSNYMTDPGLLRYGGYRDPFVNPYNYPPVLDSAHSWTPTQFNYYNSFVIGGNGNGNGNGIGGDTSSPNFSGYPYQYLPEQGGGGIISGERLVRLGSSATKEARKKRMARQRRFLSHHKINYNSQGGGGGGELHANDRCTNVVVGQQTAASNWMYWSPGGTSGAAVVPPDAHQLPIVDPSDMQVQSYQRQGWKPEKNLKFLLQKVLKQSDVGNLGRIVLPKKEAETHLPELDARDGICIAMEDIGTSSVWNMRYRFWPNNKSRMYLLENTGDFVKANGLQEGDFIVIYSDVKCGKYLIRGVKVRQPGGSKSENKKAGKSQRNLHL